MHIAIITAGGAGMFCGSCMHDNTWARSLRDSGIEVTLIPTYTPIRVDEENLSGQRVFFGGINIYLEHRLPFWRHIPRVFTRWLDHPAVIRLATRRAVSNDATELGELTLSMLDGESGPHATEVQELAAFIADDLRPDIVCFSNALLCGAVRELKRRFSGPVFCTLQGDDIFFDSLPVQYRREVIRRIAARADDFDGFITHSRYYRQHMSELIGLPIERFHQVPLGIDLAGHDGEVRSGTSPRKQPLRVGYFARICPEKGLDQLINAIRTVRLHGLDVRLVAGGFLGPRDENWFERVRHEALDLGDAFEYVGSPPDHAGKVEFLKSLDVLCVPTVYREPKGLYVLEALANGVPCVQPAHGNFPELIETTGGGLLYAPDQPEGLPNALETILRDDALRYALAVEGRKRVRSDFNLPAMARSTVTLFEPFLHKATPPPDDTATGPETS